MTTALDVGSHVTANCSSASSFAPKPISALLFVGAPVNLRISDRLAPRRSAETLATAGSLKLDVTQAQAVLDLLYNMNCPIEAGSSKPGRSR